MKLINTTLFKPRNVLIIAAIGVAVHMLASPIYKKIDAATSTSS